MRIHKLLATVLAAGLVFSGCHQDEDYLLPDIEINAESLDFSDDTELKISLTASRDWLVRSKPDWVAVDPDHGSASSNPQRVVISVLPNNDYNRTGEVLFTIGLDKAAVEVIQPGAKGEKPRGSGTLEDPYTVGGAVEYISGLAADAATTENVYIKGKISSINEEFSAQYGNGTFYITDDSGATFYVFRTMYLGNAKWTANDTQIKTGDEVVICGQVVNYKGNTPETVANKSYIYSLNGETRGSGGGNGTGTPSGTGTLADPYNAAGVNAYINTFADNAQSDKDVYVKGKISKIANNGEFGSYGNATFYITDDGSTSGEDFYCYRVLYLDKKEWKDGDTQIKVGDEVIICGKVTKYVSSYGTTPETVQKEAYIYSLNGTTGSGSSSGGEQGGSQGGEQGGGSNTAGNGTLESPYNPAAAESAAKALEQGAKTPSKVYVKGKISSIKYTFSAQYGTATFFISEDGKTEGTQFQCYSVYYYNDSAWKEGDTQIKVGDEVIIYGLLTNFNGTPETSSKEACIYSINGQTSGGSSGGEQGGSQGGEQGGSQGGEQGGGQTTSEVKTISIGDFLKVPDSDTQKYQLTGKISNIQKDKNDSSKPNAYGNFDLTDETGTVYVYGLTKEELKTDSGKGYENGKAKNDQSFNSLNLKEGDTLTLIGYKYTYTNNETSKVEVMGAYHVSHQSAE